ncbi:MAG: riboflavin kinase [Phycisphaerales bacterium]
MRAVTIGNFDGAHLGHQALVARARSLVSAAGEVIAVAFDPHPASVLRPGAEPPRLSTFDQRARWLVAAGADRVERLVPSQALLSSPPDEFIDHLCRDFHPAFIVEGPDFHFGKARAGNVETLRTLGLRHAFRADIVPGVTASLSDLLSTPVSSTIIRWLLSLGRVRDAALLLARPYTIDAVVVRGDRRGRELGFPTANLHSPNMLPADGVYAGRAILQDGRCFPAAVHVGPRATFDSPQRTIEAHLLDVPRDAPPATPPSAAIPGLTEYGWGMSLEFIAWVRDQIAFDSVPALVHRIRADCDAVRHLLAKPAHPAATTSPR